MQLRRYSSIISHVNSFILLRCMQHRSPWEDCITNNTVSSSHHVQGSEGGPEVLWLLDVGHEVSGVYTCEVTAESPPTFLTANTSVTVVVVGENSL